MILDLCQLRYVYRGDIAVIRWHPHGPRFPRLVLVVVACRVWYSIDVPVNQAKLGFGFTGCVSVQSPSLFLQ